jgi:GntR family transcriptional regulator
VRVFVAIEVYKHFPRRGIEKNKVLRLVFAHAGRAAEHMRQRMTVEPADAVLSRQLQCPVGSPVAKILRQVHGANRRLSYAGVSWYRGDAFEMDITLPRALVEDSSPSLIAPGVKRSAAGE